MVRDDAVENLYRRLRELAVTDPRSARREVSQLLDQDEMLLTGFLRHISVPGESRLRQLVANALRQHSGKEAALPFLEEWQVTECDEFACKAITAALQDRPPATRRSAQLSPVPQEYVQAYRYAAERLCHRVRNALFAPSTMIGLLERKLSRGPQGPETREIGSLLQELKQGFARVSQLVEFDVDDEYFAWRAVPLVDWIEATHRRFIAIQEPVRLTIDARLRRKRPLVRASQYLLETLFGNLWLNSVQAVAAMEATDLATGCAIRLVGETVGGRIRMTVIDNGPGFHSEASDNLFVGAYSTKGSARGRGLLESCDAIRRLQGNMQLVSVDGHYRLELDFPEHQ